MLAQLRLRCRERHICGKRCAEVIDVVIDLTWRHQNIAIGSGLHGPAIVRPWKVIEQCVRKAPQDRASEPQSPAVSRASAPEVRRDAWRIDRLTLRPKVPGRW